MLFVISHKLFIKRLSFWLGLVGAISFVVVFSIGYAALRNIEKKTQGIVTSQVIQVLNAPNESGKSKFSLHEGTKLGVLSTNDEWTSVQLANGNEGWVRTKDLGLF
jgi:flagellar basal body rod protein FlgF